MTTLVNLLFADAATAPAAIEGRLNNSIVLANVLRAGGLTVPSVDLAGAIVDLLDQPVGNLVLRGWATHRSIEKARVATAADDTAREVVRLFEHTIKSTQSPTVTASSKGIEVEVANLTLEVEVKISAANLVIERGEIAEVKTGSSTAKATLKAADVLLATRDFSPVDLVVESDGPGSPRTVDLTQ